MSNMIRPHPALRRAPLLSRPPSTIPAAAAFSARVSSPSSALPPRYVSQQRWASGGGSNGRDFMGQLYDSTQARLQREKAEQARFAAQRDLTGRGTKGAGLLARKTIPRCGSHAPWTVQPFFCDSGLTRRFLSQCSHFCRHRRGLLRRFAEARLASHRFDRSHLQDGGPEARHVDRQPAGGVGGFQGHCW